MKEFSILFIGDIVGKAGRRACQKGLAQLRMERRIDFVIANIENAAGGLGVTEEVMRELESYSIDVYTSGNHIWSKRDGLVLVEKYKNLIRPLNFPASNPGRGYCLKTSGNGVVVAVCNLVGRTYMDGYPDSPFDAIDLTLTELNGLATVTIVDFHAEATSEKIAMGWHLDGRVTAVIGTHTHVQTNDDKILPFGTGFLCDVGMTGPTDSVIGMNKEIALERFRTQLPKRYAQAEGQAEMRAVLVGCDLGTGFCRSLEKIIFSC